MLTEIDWKLLSSEEEEKTEEAYKWTNEWGQEYPYKILKREEKTDRMTEKCVSIGRMSVPYHSVPWCCLSHPIPDNKPPPASFQPFLKNSLPCLGRWILTVLDTHGVRLHIGLSPCAQFYSMEMNSFSWRIKAHKDMIFIDFTLAED